MLHRTTQVGSVRTMSGCPADRQLFAGSPERMCATFGKGQGRDVHDGGLQITTSRLGWS